MTVVGKWAGEASGGRFADLSQEGATSENRIAREQQAGKAAPPSPPLAASVVSVDEESAILVSGSPI